MSETRPDLEGTDPQRDGRLHMQRRKLFALAGAAIFLFGCIGLVVGVYVFFLGIAASHRDSVYTNQSDGACEHVLGTVTPPTRTPVVGESFKLSINFINWLILAPVEEGVPNIKENPDYCNVSIYIDAPGFEIGDNPRKFRIPPGDSKQFIAIEAKNAGLHEIVLNDGQGQTVIGLHVLSNPFFSPSQMFLISGFLACLGPMATIPWWIDYLRSRAERRSAGSHLDKKKRRQA
jgi:hypothetical protein